MPRNDSKKLMAEYTWCDVLLCAMLTALFVIGMLGCDRREARATPLSPTFYASAESGSMEGCADPARQASAPGSLEQPSILATSLKEEHSTGAAMTADRTALLMSTARPVAVCDETRQRVEEARRNLKRLRAARDGCVAQERTILSERLNVQAVNE